jgi:dTDP-4-dehydrorhamnose 3,5-epimerase
MNVVPTRLPEVLIIEPRVHGDSRGYFLETWSQPRYEEVGVAGPFRQDNISRSRKGILRGLHLQNPHEQGKLVSTLDGEVFDVAVDVRVGSPRFGRWVGVVLSDQNHRQLWIPPGFAHGFCVLSEEAIFHYKCTEIYHAECEIAVAWNDPAIGIDWPLVSPAVSDRDSRAPRLDSIARDRLPRFAQGRGAS